MDAKFTNFAFILSETILKMVLNLMSKLCLIFAEFAQEVHNSPSRL
jgi:hypothetical protein